MTVDRQVPIAIRFVESFGADLIVAGKVIVELKSVERVTAAHNKRLSRNSNNNKGSSNNHFIRRLIVTDLPEK